MYFKYLWNQRNITTIIIFRNAYLRNIEKNLHIYKCCEIRKLEKYWEKQEEDIFWKKKKKKVKNMKIYKNIFINFCRCHKI